MPKVTKRAAMDNCRVSGDSGSSTTKRTYDTALVSVALLSLPELLDAVGEQVHQEIGRVLAKAWKHPLGAIIEGAQQGVGAE